MKYFSMFTGVGGFELGIKNKGHCIGFSENDKYCSELLKKRFPGIKNYGDAREINADELPDFDFLVGGFPCQAFSIAGKRKGFEDTRGTLFHEIARILEAKRPNYFLLENVKGLLNHDRGKTFAVILASLSELGYVIQWMVLNSKFFGVPQNRERVFIIGSLGEERIPEILPFKERSRDSLQRNTQREDTMASTITGGIAKHSKRGTHLKQIINRGQADRVYSIEGISKTLAGQAGGRGAKTGLYLDKSRIRRLTPIECERLQGFPDNWTEGFSDTQRYRMMGNAVTVNVIAAIMERFL